jgi:hypothetical protein
LVSRVEPQEEEKGTLVHQEISIHKSKRVLHP